MRILAAAAVAVCLCCTATATPGAAQAPVEPVFVPKFTDPKQRVTRPDGDIPRSLWFLTEDDYPPFNFAAPDGSLTGFNVDLARAICEELQVACTVQARRWDTLLEALENRRGDAVIASMSVTAELRQRFAVSKPYYRTPARFAVASDGPLREASPAALSGRRVAVASGSAHEAYLNAHFPGLQLKRETSFDLALESLRRGEADAVFGDGIGIAFWLNGEASAGCCRFLPGAFTESRYFGEGAGVVMRKGDVNLRRAIDYALSRISADGRFARLYLRYFPVGFY